MAYYPSFAFFTQAPALDELASSLSGALEEWLPELAVEVPGPPLRTETNRAEALRLLGRSASAAERFWLTGALHSLECWLVRSQYLSIDFGDYDAELYDGGLSDLLRREKRDLALALHGALLRGGATLTYTSSADDKAATLEAPVDGAARLAALLATGDTGALPREILQARPWLLGVASAAYERALAALLREHFEASPGRPGLYEHRALRPLFWDLGARR